MAFDIPYTFTFEAATTGVLTTYTGLKAAIGDWLARQGDTDIDARFDDFLSLHESRMYHGRSPLPTLGLIACEPLRVAEMEARNDAFELAAVVGQPDGFLELIEATLNSPLRPLDIVSEGVLAAYGSGTLGGTQLIAVSGKNFLLKDATTGTATLKYFSKLSTPDPETSNAILQAYPNVYLNGLLYEASVYIGDAEAAKLYYSLYAADVQSLNERRNGRLMHATNVRMRLRARTP